MTQVLTATNLTPSGSVATFADAVAAIRAGGTYFNLHTSAHPGGEIRGQIGVTVAAPAPTPAPTAAPPAPTAEVTVPPTATAASVAPSGNDGASWFIAMAGLLAAAGTLAWIGRRRSSATR